MKNQPGESGCQRVARAARALGILSGVCAGLAVGSVVWEWLAAGSTIDFFRKARTQERQDLAAADPQPAAVLLPLKGASEINRASLQSILGQDYPQLEVIVGMEDTDTAAIEFIRELQQDPSGHELRLAPGKNSRGGRSQANNIINASRLTQTPFVVVMDADIVADPGFLRRFVAPLSDPTVGATTCLYRTGSDGGLGSVLDALWTSTSYLPSALFGRHVIGEGFAFGAARSVRRDVLEKFGGFDAIDPRGMDDYQLGMLTSRAGYKVRFVPTIVTELMPRITVRQLLNRRVRWFRNIRILRPWGYAGSLVTHGLPLAVLAAILSPRKQKRAALRLLSVVLLNRLACASAALRYLDPQAPRIQVALVPLRDVIASIAWIVAFTPARNPADRLSRKR